FLSERARRYPSFRLHMRAQVTGLIEEDGRVVGVRATTPDGPLEVRAGLVVGADGRHSTGRERAGLKVQDLAATIDVVWFRLPRRPGDPSNPLGRFDRGKILVLVDRGDYWQCGYVIPKGGFDEIRRRGLASFRETLTESAPFLQGRVDELGSWDE